jgi:NAD(P)-dependent dehydrogenase (short-subunit alcohol dehydrogenase family)
VRPHRITVNAVLPSTMDTPANRRAMPDADRSGWVSTADVASVVAFLLSDRAAAVTGASLTV